jgi:hypothetical protein
LLRDLQGYVSPYAVGPSVLNMLLSYIINRRISSLTEALLNLQTEVVREIPVHRERFIKVS